MDNPKDFTVAAQGKDEKDALDQLSGGWFTADNPPPEAVAAANANGFKVFRFRVTVAGLGEVRAETSVKYDKDGMPCECIGCVLLAIPGDTMCADHRRYWGINGEAPCKKCGGCGQVADTEDQEPWTVWLAMPLGSAAAVLAGIVKPISCPECKGRT